MILLFGPTGAGKSMQGQMLAVRQGTEMPTAFDGSILSLYGNVQYGSRARVAAMPSTTMSLGLNSSIKRRTRLRLEAVAASYNSAIRSSAMSDSCKPGSPPLAASCV